jgi:hypothetical protein
LVLNGFWHEYEVMKSIPESPERGRVKIAQHGLALFFGAEPNAGVTLPIKQESPLGDG